MTGKFISKVRNGWRVHTADVSTTLAVEVAFKSPGAEVMISDTRYLRKGKVTLGFSVFRSRIKDTKVTSQNPTPMTVCCLVPPCGDTFRNTFKQNVKESDGINPNLRENMGL